MVVAAASWGLSAVLTKVSLQQLRPSSTCSESS